jgi:shikimate dehydrogenase
LINMQRSNLPTFNLGLTGYPLSHSLSPRIHAAALKSCGFEGDYTLFPISPEHQQDLKELIDRVRCSEIHGLNVTIPHKQNVIPYLDELTSTAQAIGAVNTIYLQNGSLIGDNTDAAGFLKDLNSFLSIHRSNTLAPGAHPAALRAGASVPWRSVPGSAGVEDRKSALVLGAGGSARAVAYALIKDGWQVTIAARRLAQAQQLANSFTNYQFTNYQLPITDFTLSNLDLSNITLLVNTTPVGMTPNADQSPWPEHTPFPPGAAVYDLVYNPGETKLVREARRHGVPATTGLGMLVEQAALSFEKWTGHNPSREGMLEAISQSAY